MAKAMHGSAIKALFKLETEFLSREANIVMQIVIMNYSQLAGLG